MGGPLDQDFPWAGNVAEVGYAAAINECLRPAHERAPLVLDLFAGCGGLALGFEAQGFETLGLEMDPSACETYGRNLRGACEEVHLTTETTFPAADIVIGGPPCQPFSVGGHQRGHEDERNGLPAFIAAIDQLRPSFWLFENVRGLLYRNRWYLDEVVERLRGFGYVVEHRLLNAVDHGVPQNRQRVVVVGHRGGAFPFPRESRRRVSAGEALDDLMPFGTPPESKFLTAGMDAYVARYETKSQCVRPRDLHLDRPARTLTCRNIAAPTGDMHRVRLPDGRRRRLLLREAARLQTFPDWFEFCGKEEACFYQVGNAVPPLLAFQLAASVRGYLDGDRAEMDEVELPSGQVAWA